MYVNNYLKLIKFSNLYYPNSYVPCIKNSRDTSYTVHESLYSLPLRVTSEQFYAFSGKPTEKASSSSGRGFAIYAGTGSTLPSVEDIDLEADANLEFITGSALYNEDAGTVTITFVRKNSSQESITIRETCLCVNGNNNYYPVMIARDVLNDPVTLAPGETITITYKIS